MPYKSRKLEIGIIDITDGEDIIAVVWYPKADAFIDKLDIQYRWFERGQCVDGGNAFGVVECVVKLDLIISGHRDIDMRGQRCFVEGRKPEPIERESSPKGEFADDVNCEGTNRRRTRPWGANALIHAQFRYFRRRISPETPRGFRRNLKLWPPRHQWCGRFGADKRVEEWKPSTRSKIPNLQSIKRTKGTECELCYGLFNKVVPDLWCRWPSQFTRTHQNPEISQFVIRKVEN